jgi:hypothetical protein
MRHCEGVSAHDYHFLKRPPGKSRPANKGRRSKPNQAVVEASVGYVTVLTLLEGWPDASSKLAKEGRKFALEGINSERDMVFCRNLAATFGYECLRTSNLVIFSPLSKNQNLIPEVREVFPQRADRA